MIGRMMCLCECASECANVLEGFRSKIDLFNLLITQLDDHVSVLNWLKFISK